MKKKWIRDAIQNGIISKTWKVMRLCIFFLMLFLSQVWATSGYSQHVKLNLNMRNAKILDVLDKIEENSEYSFLFNQRMVNVERRVDIRVTDKTVETVLKQLFNGTNVNYLVKGNQIVLTTRSKIFRGSTQQKVVTGKVTDAEGQPLPGVSIVIEGTTIGVTSDIDGNYSIEVSAKTILRFSFVGMIPQDVPIENRSVINVTMKADAVGLEEVIAIGYGTQKKVNLTGSIASMKTDKIAEVPYASVKQAMSGRIAGVFTDQTGVGGPGDSDPEIRVRGVTGQLVVVDGIIGRSYSDIDPNDIESFTVLKDAAACAVYGARAANGVILITTKRGAKEGKVKINYNGNTSFSEPIVFPDKLGVRDHVAMRNLANFNDGNNYRFHPDEWNESRFLEYEDDDLNHYQPLNMNDIFRNYAVMHNHNLNMSGKSGNTNYYTSIGYQNQGPIYHSDISRYKKYNIRGNIDHYFENIGLKMGMDLSFRKTIDKEPIGGENGIMYRNYHAISAIQPNPPVYTDGRYSPWYLVNPIRALDPDMGYQNEESQKFNSRLYLEYEVPFVKGLKLKAVGAYDDVSTWYKQWSTPIETYNTYESTTANNHGSPSLYEKYGYTRSYNAEFHVNYSKQINKHDFKLMAVYSQSEKEYDYFSAQKKTFISSEIGEFALGENENMAIGGYGQMLGRMGLVGRVQYNYGGKYLFEGNFRYDGSQNFAKGHRWGFFPSASAAWRVSEEPFFKSWVPESIINNFKIRMSYGETGDDSNVMSYGWSTYPYLSKYSTTGTYYFDGSKNVALAEDNIASTDITWETQQSYNAGIDVTFGGNKFEFIFDTYFVKRNDLLLSVSDKSNTLLGIAFPKVNSGIKRRGGFEFSLNYHDTFFNELKVNLGFNYSYYNEFWEFKNESPVTLKDPNARLTHRSTYGRYWYVSDGLYQTLEEVQNNPWMDTVGEMQPGDIVVQDLNGDGHVDSRDKRYVGEPTFPTNVFGATVNLQYRGFELDALIQGAHNLTTTVGEGWYNIRWRMMAHVHHAWVKGKHWSADNTNATLPRLGYDRYNYGVNSDFWLVDNDYIRLKSLKIGYDLKHKLIKSNKISSCKIYLSGTNLLTWKKVWGMFDPEDKVNEHENYPIMRTYSIGLNITF
ncbi:SusC/RagA family TonB-linked outer membrane protein [Prolixibacteraceae bacterium JC049]|nr:SusC/RagA family TonB-linked outer membrane protein [Prolixibacteraceae bacterium JC049]